MILTILGNFLLKTGEITLMFSKLICRYPFNKYHCFPNCLTQSFYYLLNSSSLYKSKLTDEERNQIDDEVGEAIKDFQSKIEKLEKKGKQY